MKTQRYLYFDTVGAEWKEASFEELAMLDDPELAICPITPDGAPGQETTYAALEKSVSRMNRPVPQQPQPQMQKQAVVKAPLPTEQLLRFTLRYICTCITFLVFCSAYALGYALFPEDDFLAGALFASAICCIFYYRAKRAANSDHM